MTKSFNLPSISAKDVLTFTEMVQEDFLKAPVIADYATVFPNIPYNTNIAIPQEIGLIGLADQGCNPTYTNQSVAVTTKQWTPKAWSVNWGECYNDYIGTLVEPQFNVSPNRPDLINTELVDFLLGRFSPALERMMMRFLWFNDTAAALVTASPAGVITAGQTIGYWNVYDGYFKQLYDICTTTPARRTTIAANAQATYSLQDSQLSTTLAYTYLLNTTYDCNNIVKENIGKYFILCTQEMYDKAKQYIQATTIPNTYLNMENGIQVLRVNGVPVYPQPLWSQYIRAYEADGTKYHDPHRAVLMSKDNFGIAVPKNDIVLGVDVWFDKKTKNTYFDAMGVMDMKILIDKAVQFAY